MDAIAAFAEHVVARGYADLSAEAVAATKTFILDSFGVGVAGSGGPWVRELIESCGAWGAADAARVWVHGAALPAPAAAMCNGYQIHNSEYDCVHEAAVVHPMAVLLAATTAYAERAGGVSGREFLTAIALGVDVGVGLGIASKAPLRFFRPATAGAFAATAAIGRLRGFDAATLINAFSFAYGQLCGTMQAHTEGSPLLALQIGFNARNAVVACDLAASGLVGPQNLLEGPFGYYRLFESAYDMRPVLDSLGTSLADRRGRAQAVSLRPGDPRRARRALGPDERARVRRARGRADRLPRAAAHAPPRGAAGARRHDLELRAPLRPLRARLRSAGRRCRPRRFQAGSARRSGAARSRPRASASARTTIPIPMR